MRIKTVEMTPELQMVLDKFVLHYKVTKFGYVGFLFKNDNYNKICVILKTLSASDKITFLSNLEALYASLEHNNLLNQTNFDFILNNHSALDENFEFLIESAFNIYGIYSSSGKLTPHILNFLLLELQNHYAHSQHADRNEIARNLNKALLLFLNTGSTGNGRTSINSRFDFIVNNYHKIPEPIFELFDNIPRYKLSMNVFRDLVKIFDQNITAMQLATQITDFFAALIGIRQAQGNQLNYEQSVHNSAVEKSVADSAEKLNALYPGVYSDALLESNLVELVAFAKSLKKTDAEKYASTAIMRLINSPRDNQIRRSGITNKQALALVWVALHDESKYLPGVTLAAAKENFVKSLVNIERAYNVDENDRDQGGESMESCPSGTFNMIIGALNTIHTEVGINFNSRELAGMRLKAIINDEIKKYLEKYPELSTEMKDKTIDQIEELNTSIVTSFNSNQDNLIFIDVLACLPTLTINSILEVNSKPVPAVVVEEEPAANAPELNENSWLKRTFKSIKDYLQQKFSSVTFNPFANVPYSDANENTLDHPLPHTRTLHTSLFRKIADTFSVLYGSDNLQLDRHHEYRYGLIDYLTSLGLLKTAEILLFQYINNNRRSTFKAACANVAFYLIYTLNFFVKSLAGGYIALFALPIVIAVHIAAKIALAIETWKANKTLTTDSHSGTTASLKTKFKENQFQPLSKNNEIATNVVPHKPIEMNRKVLFAANHTRDYVTADFLLTSRKDINRARSIARVKREACHELNSANLLSYKRVRNKS